MIRIEIFNYIYLLIPYQKNQHQKLSLKDEYIFDTSTFYPVFNIDLDFLIPRVITQSFSPTTELAILIGILTKEAKTELEHIE